MAAIQIISKADWKAQTIVPVIALPGPLTAPNTVRIKTRLISLTTNTFTYARLGGIVPAMGWWHVWQLHRDALPRPYSDDADKYTRISAWGFSEVIESAIPDLKKGTKLYGYQPIATAAEDLVLEKDPSGARGHWLERSDYRKDLHDIYNRYVVHEELDESKKYDALMQVLWGTGFLMNRFVFAWGEDSRSGSKPVHPSGLSDPEGKFWGRKEADLSQAVVVLLAASGKTGLGFSHELRQRPQSAKPLRTVAVSSAQSRQFSLDVGLFDEVWTYDKVTEFVETLGSSAKKIVLVDFGARGNSADEWAVALQGKTEDFRGLVVGRDPLSTKPNSVMNPSQDPRGQVLQVGAGVVRNRAFKDVGVAEYFEKHTEAWETFKKSEAVRPIRFKTGKGLHEFKEGWDRLAKGEHSSDVGLVFEL